MSSRSAAIHWCLLADQPKILAGKTVAFLDGGSVRQGKNVQIFAEAVTSSYNPQPDGFEIRLASFFLRKVALKLLGKWNPMPPISGVNPNGNKWFGSNGWQTGTSRITRQSDYFIRDKDKNRSGGLTVSECDHAVSKPNLEVAGALSISGAGVAEIRPEVTVKWSGTEKHFISSTRDPMVRVVLMHPGGEGEADLGAHVAELVRDFATVQGIDANSEGVTRLIDEYRSGDTPWVATFENGSQVMTAVVGPEQGAEIRVPLDDMLDSGRQFGTAYALRVVNVEDKSDFVIGDIVELTVREGSIRITA
jgi:hypothetical protein